MEKLLEMKNEALERNQEMLHINYGVACHFYGRVVALEQLLYWLAVEDAKERAEKFLKNEPYR